MTPRRPTSWILLICTTLVAGSTAWAMPPGPRSEIERELEHPTPPGPGLERAQLRGIPWCGGVRERDRDWAFYIPNDLHEYRTSRYAQDRLVRTARGVCSEPDDPLVQRVATEVLQLWINETGMTARDAVESLALRADKDGFQAERTALCDAIKPRGDAMYSEHAVLATARFKLFGCRRDDPLWMRADNVEHLGPYIDRGSAARDDLAHLAWVLHRQHKELEPGNEDALVGYAIDQFDFHAVSADAAIRQLDAAPYRGSRYARVMVLESLGRAQLMTAKIEALVARRVSDPEWKEMLITAPDRGAAAWNAAAERDRAALARSDEFDRKLREGGDIHGCQAVLRPDFLAILKTLKHDDILTLETAMSDHLLVGLLASRVGRCMKADGDPYTKFAGGVLLSELASHVRVIHGPRTAAYYAVLDGRAARGHTRDDDDEREERARLRSRNHRAPRPLGFSDSRSGVISILTDVLEGSTEESGAATNDFLEGVIKSVGKGKGKGKVVHVVFVTKKEQSIDEVCRETNKIDRKDPRTGKIYYRKVCHDTAPKWVDVGPDPVDVPVDLAGALQPGRYATFASIAINNVYRMDSTAKRLPLEVYRGVQKDKDDHDRMSGKHLIALYGFVLE